MSGSSWMIERLNRETSRYHRDADVAFDTLFQEASPTHYLVFLMRTYGFEAPTESALAMTPSLVDRVDLRDRQRARFLVEDLLALGLRPGEVAEVPQCMAIPQFEDLLEAFGWMYVLERATLAHAVMRRHLLTKLPREMASASAYLQSYGGVVGVRWRDFGGALDAIAQSTGEADQIVEAATQAFVAQHQWMTHDQHTRAQAI